MNTKKQFLLAVGLLFTIATSAQQNERIPAKGFAYAPNGHFQELDFTRHPIGDNDIKIDILYAGICHSDLHTADMIKKGDMPPIVLGHEIVGKISAVGKNVTKFKIGDYAGVGCIVHSCGECTYCEADKEQFCLNGTTFNYSPIDKYHDDEIAHGGYSTCIVLGERWAVKVPDNADLKRVPPLLCAGVTTFSPIQLSHVHRGDNVGVAGFGGLGHMALKYMVELGANVTVFDLTEDKREDALRMGAKKYVNVKNEGGMKGLENSFDFILSTIPMNFEPMTYMQMLKIDTGEMCVVGLDDKASISTMQLIQHPASRRRIYGSLIGGIKETQEAVDYSISHDIYPEVEVINADATIIDNAYQNVLDGKVKYRYVIDMKTLK